ncbi:MAG: protein kinase domain-containing protein [Planctomycetota bacterium]|jgi:serine/threonine-protein kinase
MAEPTASDIADRALDLELLNERQLQEIWAVFGSHNVSLEEFLQHLVRREYLTNYQVDRLVKGERTGFFFGDYKVLYLVGTGTFARVFRAVHKRTGQIVGVKVLRRRYAENSRQSSMFVREGNLGKALRHPNIVPIHEVHSRGSVHYLVMEFVQGWNLRELMKIRKKMDPAEATRLTIGIASGLRHAFDRGLTHRDLKMSNVLVSSQGQPKLVDFGLAAIDEKSADDFIDEHTSARAIDYAALERATGVQRDDTRSDIYFLGCMYYHMLIGSPPLAETTDRLQRLSRGRFLEIVPIQEVDPSIPSSVVLAVSKAMSLDPARRYQTPAEVIRDLGTVAEQLSLGDAGDDDEAERARQRDRLAAELRQQKQQPSVMVVESSGKMQDVFRSGLKRAGFRVLMTSDPQMALHRFRQDPKTAHCVLFNAQEIGREALDTFNLFGEDRRLDALPAVLLVNQRQQHFKDDAKTTDHRVVLSLPLTMRQLRATLAKLVPSQAVSASS